jgi:hypothetical protein
MHKINELQKTSSDLIARHPTDDHVGELETKLLLLRSDFLGETDVAYPAQAVV